jgi:SAM-dependent methyltransferase
MTGLDRMRADIYQLVAEKQDTYWWNRARRGMAQALLRRHHPERGGRWLDLGCGPGGNLIIAESFCPKAVVGLDVSPVALALAKIEFSHELLVRADINRSLPFPNQVFDVVTLFNVLYHDWVVDDRDALSEVSRVLRPGGLLLITEPAFPILSREWDNAVMGSRRYRGPQLVVLCRATGLEVKFWSYFTSFGFPILCALKIANKIVGLATRWHRPSETRALPRFVNEALYYVAMLEAKAICLGIKMPFGVTLVAVAKRV